VKTAIAIESVEDDRLVYFHNGGLFTLSGEDLAQVFSWRLPGYVELVRFDAGPRLVGDELRATARELLREHLLRRPERNPFVSFGAQLGAELDELVQLDDVGVHAFAFATTRMAGAAAALAAAHVRWCLPGSSGGAAECLDRVALTTRTLTIRLVRRKPFDPGPLITALAGDWAEAQERLDEIAG
jgi:hypothetical protein